MWRVQMRVIKGGVADKIGATFKPNLCTLKLQEEKFKLLIKQIQQFC
jgi:hypothetical protein